MDIENQSQIDTHPLKENLFENMIVMEFLKTRFNQGKNNNLNFYRDKIKEVDLIMREAAHFTAVEIKYAETIKSNLWESLDYVSKLFPKECNQKILVYGGAEEQNRTGLRVIPFNRV